MILGITAADALDLCNKHNEEVDTVNLEILSSDIVSKITREAKKGLKTLTVSYPLDPKKNSANRQFLIAEGRKKFDIYFCDQIIEMLNKEGFTTEVVSSTDSMTGVSHKGFTIKW